MTIIDASMSIFGILNINEAPVTRENLIAMRDGMTNRGPANSSIWQVKNIGIGYLSPLDIFETRDKNLPLWTTSCGVVLTARARIDNREELLSVITKSKIYEETITTNHGSRATSRKSLAITSDSELIMHAYLHWDEECVHHLIGDWAFAVWDSRKHKLFIARDHHGISSIYYYYQPHFFAFASSIKGLLALPSVPRHPNLFRIAQVLTSWFSGDGVQSAYRGISQLPPAHTLTVTTQRAEVRRYWFLEDTPPIRFRSDGEYVEAFLEIYTEAVRCRLRTPSSPTGGGNEWSRIGAALSSGLDSGSVCALTACELRSLGRRLPVFTSVPIYPTEGVTGKYAYGDETHLVEVNRSFIPNLDVYYIRAESVTPLTGIAYSLRTHDSPMHAAGNMFWLHALLDTAKQQGISVVLIGQGGNGTISWKGSMESFWPLLVTGQWLELWHRSKHSEVSLWDAVKRHLLQPLILPVRKQMRYFRFPRQDPWIDYSAINTEFARSLDLSQRMRESGHDPLFVPPSNPIQARLQHLEPGISINGKILAEIGYSYGLELRDPTIDKRLMEFCFALPEEQYHLAGQDRALIRRAMIGLLPDDVRLNTRRGRQAADIGYRLLAELPRVQAFMAQLETSELARRVLDLPKMQSVLDTLQIEINQKTTEQCITILTRGLMAGMFLLRFE